jgi:Leucine-rich repeat (LRR) protein
LDRKKIKKIKGPFTNENGLILENVMSLYLQHNEIEEIENLEHFPRLRFLALFHNKLKEIKNIEFIKTLKFLDLSNNQIEEIPKGKMRAEERN